MLISEGLFAAANIFSNLKLVYIFSINPHLGPLQVTLGRMVFDMMKWALLFILVHFAFSCGELQLAMHVARGKHGKYAYSLGSCPVVSPIECSL